MNTLAKTYEAVYGDFSKQLSKLTSNPRSDNVIPINGDWQSLPLESKSIPDIGGLAVTVTVMPSPPKEAYLSVTNSSGVPLLSAAGCPIPDVDTPRNKTVRPDFGVVVKANDKETGEVVLDLTIRLGELVVKEMDKALTHWQLAWAELSRRGSITDAEITELEKIDEYLQPPPDDRVINERPLSDFTINELRLLTRNMAPIEPPAEFPPHEGALSQEVVELLAALGVDGPEALAHRDMPMTPKQFEGLLKRILPLSHSNSSEAVSDAVSRVGGASAPVAVYPALQVVH